MGLMDFLDVFSFLDPIGAIARGALEDKEKAKKKQKEFEEALPKPDPPVVQGQAGVTSANRRIVKAGRGGTILTGQLIPRNIGKSRLLG